MSILTNAGANMQILKNKHLVLAMFVAPVLAIIAYFSVDHMVSEKPHAALPGNAYKLAAQPNCHYQSGACTLKNGDIEVHIHARRVAEKEVELSMQSALPIQHAIVSCVSDDIAAEPVAMNAASADMNNWQITLPLAYPEKTQLRLALSISDSMYYAETTAVFVDYKTSFSRENFSR